MVCRDARLRPTPLSTGWCSYWQVHPEPAPGPDAWQAACSQLGAEPVLRPAGPLRPLGLDVSPPTLLIPNLLPEGLASPDRLPFHTASFGGLASIAGSCGTPDPGARARPPGEQPTVSRGPGTGRAGAGSPFAVSLGALPSLCPGEPGQHKWAPGRGPGSPGPGPPHPSSRLGLDMATPNPSGPSPRPSPSHRADMPDLSLF